jgi:hypothetical protein
MNPECYALKKKTQLDRDAAELTTAGKTVVTGNAAKQALTAGGDVKGTTYVALKDVRGLLKNVKPDERPKTVLIQDQRTGKTVEAIKRTELASAGVNAQEASASRDDKHKANRAKWEKKAEQENAWRMALLDDIRTAMRQKARSTFELRMLATRLISGVYGDEAKLMQELYGVDDVSDIEELIETMSPNDIGMLLMDVLLTRKLRVSSYHLEYHGGKAEKTQLHDLAKHHGIDPDQHRAAFNAAKGLSTPQPAAQAPKKAGGKAKKSAATPRPAGAAVDQVNAQNADAGAGAADGQADEATLPLNLEQPSIQPATPEGNEFHARNTEPDSPSGAWERTLSPQAAWPFPKPKPAPAVTEA